MFQRFRNFASLVLLMSFNVWGISQSAVDLRADSLRNLAMHASSPAESSDRWLELSKHYRKSNLDSSQTALTQAMRAAKLSGDKDRQQRCNMSQGALKWMLGDLEAAEQRYLEAIRYWSGKNDTIEVTRCLLNLGSVCQVGFKNKEAAKYLKKSLLLAQRAGQQLIAAQAAGSVAMVFFQMGEPDSVGKYSEIANQGFIALHDSANLARVHANLGFFYRDLGLSYEARQPYLQALEYLKGSDEIGLKGEIHDGIGILENKLGNFQEAIDHYLIAGECFQQLKWHKKIANINNTIGLAFKTLGRKSTAQAYFAEAYRLADSIENYPVAAGALSNLASLDREAGNFLLAAAKYKQAIRLELKAASPGDLYSNYLGLGLCNQAMGQVDSANHYLELAFSAARRSKNELQIADCHFQKAKQMLALRQHTNALAALDSAGHWYAQIRNAGGMRETYALRSQCHEALGDYLSALTDQRTASRWQDSMLVISANSQLLALEAKFWSEKKQHALEIARQNEALQAKEAERAQEAGAKLAAQRNLLVTALVLTLGFGIGIYWINLKRRRTQLHRKLAEMRMTALRAQMNPHFIFNALGSVQLLINTSAIREANLYLSKFAQLLRITLERSGAEDSTLQDEIDALKLYIDLEALRFKFRYEIELDPQIEADDIAFPTLLLQPIVENAVKHGLAPKQTEGLLHLQFRKVGDELLCTIQDNGVGRLGAKKRNLHPDDGHKSMGNQITQERLLLLQPVRSDRFKILDLSDADGNATGTLVEIRIPIQFM